MALTATDRAIAGVPRVNLASVAAYARETLDSVAAVRSAWPAPLSVALPGIRMDVHAQNGRFAEAIRANYIQAPRSETYFGPPRRVTIFVAHPGAAAAALPRAWAEEVYLPHEIDEKLAPHGLKAAYYHDLNYWQIYDVGAGRGVQLMSGPDAFPPWDPGAPLRPFLHWEYASRGLRLTHCGTLGVNGSGVLLAGSGGAGKSGTVVAGLLRGLQSVGDDYVLVDASSNVTAYPVFATLKQDLKGFSRLGLSERLGPAGPLNWQGKIEFRIGDIAAGPQVERLKIKALLVPRIGGSGRSRILPISRREAMLALAPSSINQMPGERGTGFAFFGRLVNQLPCHAIDLGPSPTEIADTIARFIEGASS
jgi:hypothetical protein